MSVEQSRNQRRHRKRDSQSRLLLPMPGDEYKAWLFAMPFMYSHVGVGPAIVSWLSAKSLLLLAHKYNMPGLTSNVLAFFKSAALDGPQAWVWLQLACNPALELPDFITQRCIDTIVAGAGQFGAVNWPSNQENGITMQVARRLYSALVTRYENLAGKLATTQNNAAAAACAAAEEAKKQQEAAVAASKRQRNDMVSDISWLAKHLHNLLPSDRGYGGYSHDMLDGWELRDINDKLSSICHKYGCVSIAGQDDDSD